MPITEQVLVQQLERLQLRYFLEHYPDLAAQAARESWTHGHFLEHLVAGEAARRDETRVARRVKAAHLPGLKTLDGFDWSWPKKINRAQVQHLFRLEFLPQQGNVILLGGVGVGKTHLAIALAHKACLQGHTVLFTRAVDIVNALAAAQTAPSRRLKIHCDADDMILTADTDVDFGPYLTDLSHRLLDEKCPPRSRNWPRPTRPPRGSSQPS